jgi:hypothetical protein
MPLSRNVMRGGFSAGQAQAAGGHPTLAIAAAGTTQGTATALTDDINVVATVASGAGVILYAAMPGDTQIVYNDQAVNSLLVYPPTGAKINNIATNGAHILAPNTFCEYFAVSATRWIADLSA